MRQRDDARVFDLSDPGLWIPAYHEINWSKKRFKLLYGSRGRGGSTNVAQVIVTRMLEERFTGMMVRKVFEDIRGSQWETLRQLVCDEWKLEPEFDFNKAPLGVVCKVTGANLIARGLDKPGRAKSVPGLALAWYEEADELSAEDFRQTSLSIRGRNIEEWLTFNAPRDDHWLLQRFFPGSLDKEGGVTVDLSFETEDGMFVNVPSTDPDAIIVHGCYKHNPFTRPEFIKIIEREAEVDPEAFRVNGLGLIGSPKTGKEFFHAFSSARHVGRCVFDPSKSLHIGFDFNRSPYMTLVIFQLHRQGEKYLAKGIKEYCLGHPLNTTEAVCRAFLHDLNEGDLKGHEGRVFVYGDYSGKTGRTTEREGMRDDYAVVWSVLAPVLDGQSDRVKPNPHHAKVGRWMNWTLQGKTVVELLLDPSMVNTIKDFQSVQQDVDGAMLKKKEIDRDTGKAFEKYGHTSQATYYILTSAFSDSFATQLR
nr:MAG: terminase large subunit [Caudoviricetes sp.]